MLEKTSSFEKASPPGRSLVLMSSPSYKPVCTPPEHCWSLRMTVYSSNKTVSFANKFRASDSPDPSSSPSTDQHKVILSIKLGTSTTSSVAFPVSALSASIITVLRLKAVPTQSHLLLSPVCFILGGSGITTSRTSSRARVSSLLLSLTLR